MRAAAAGLRVAMGACSGAHHWARKLRSMGFEPRLIAPAQADSKASIVLAADMSVSSLWPDPFLLV